MTTDPLCDPSKEESNLVQNLAKVLSTTASSELAVRGLRIHAQIEAGGLVLPATLDCTRTAPYLQPGHSGPAHVVVHVDECALVPLLAAPSFHDLFPYFQDGKIRLQRGLFNVLRLVRDPRTTRDNAPLRVALQAAVDAST